MARRKISNDDPLGMAAALRAIQATPVRTLRAKMDAALQELQQALTACHIATCRYKEDIGAQGELWKAKSNLFDATLKYEKAADDFLRG